MNASVYSPAIQAPSASVIAREEVSNIFTWILRGSIFVALLLGFFYLLSLNKLATKGFALEELKTERMAIQQEVEKWDIEVTIPTSLYALQSSEQVQEMVDAGKGRVYVLVKEGQVAMNNGE